MSWLFNQHDSLKGYQSYIKSDKVTRHAPFLKMLRKYETKQASLAEIAECEGGVKQLASHRTRFSRDAVISQVLSSHERSGIQEKVNYDYVEHPVWQAENPGKVAPKIVKAWVIDTETGL